jgi:osmotically-inducible protein OsmY
MTAASQASPNLCHGETPGDDGMNLLAPATTPRQTFPSSSGSTISSVTEERLRASGYRALSSVSCIARDGVAYLHGCLPSYYLKQLAQEIAAAVNGVSLVVNKINVNAPVRTKNADKANDAL